MKLLLRVSLALFVFVAIARAQALKNVAFAALNGAGLPANGFVDRAFLSNDGRFSVFRTFATNLGFPPPAANQFGLYCRDGLTGQVTLLAADAAGGPLDCTQHFISADAREVVFTAPGTLVTPTTPALPYQTYLLDRQTGARTLLSKTAAGVPSNATINDVEDISADGRFVLISSNATNLPGQTASAGGLWRIDRTTGAYEPVMIPIAGGLVNGTLTIGKMSSDGRFVAFVSDASNLVPNDTNGAFDTFLRDMNATAIERVSVTTLGTQQSASILRRPAVSDDGRFVVFRGGSSTIATNGNLFGSTYVVRDRVFGTTEFLAVGAAGFSALADFSDTQPAWIEPAGNIVYFTTATDFASPILVTGGVPVLWAKNLVTGSLTRAVMPQVGSSSSTSIEAIHPTMSKNGRYVTFVSSTATIVPGDPFGTYDAFVGEVPCGFEAAMFGAGHAGSGGVVPILLATNGTCDSVASFVMAGALGGAPAFLLIGERSRTSTLVGQASIVVDLSPQTLVMTVPTIGIPGTAGTGAWFASGDVSALQGFAFAMQGIFVDPGASGGFAATAGLMFSVF